MPDPIRSAALPSALEKFFQTQIPQLFPARRSFLVPPPDPVVLLQRPLQFLGRNGVAGAGTLSHGAAELLRQAVIPVADPFPHGIAPRQGMVPVPAFEHLLQA